MTRAARPGASPAGGGASAGPGAARERSTALRLASLHVRMGSLPLARAELESLAGRMMLDEDAMLDLAEVRWRTGDLAGAGEAANALLARGRNDLLALVIAAEAVAALGRPGEARRLASRALMAADGPLDPLFAGIPRSLIWPDEAVTAPGAPPSGQGGPDSTGDATSRRRAGAATAATAAAKPDEAPAPASTGAAEAYAGGRAALGAGDAGLAAVRLGVALRLEPGYAKDVLEVIGDREEPALALAKGDALRLLGRESEALAAYDQARGRPHAAVDDEAAADDESDDEDPA